MCGRYTQRHGASALINRFSIQRLLFDPKPRYNLAPTQDVPVILTDAGQRVLKTMRWGLVPHWADDPSIGNRMINARAETLAEKPAFRDALRHRRCIIPADGFYEWSKRGKTRTPHHIHRPDGQPMALAGLWDRWTSKTTGEVIESVTIITVACNDLIRPLHDRIPAILPPPPEGAQAESTWLDPTITDPAALLPLLSPCESADLVIDEVSRRVNTASYDAPDCLTPPPPEAAADEPRREPANEPGLFG
jgi:putative SOS response-associated peptidase YedK